MSAASSQNSSHSSPLWAKVLYFAVILAFAGSLQQMLQAPPASPAEGKDPRVAKGHFGAVATASPESSAAAMLMLQKGGNAADALVAASFAVSVTRPQSTGIGGGGFLVYHDSESAKNTALDFRETAPKAAHKDMYKDKMESRLGPRAAGIPGVVQGLREIHKRYGKLSWAEVVEPAIKLARDGFIVDRGLAYSCKVHQQKLQKWPATAAVFLPGGKPLKAGQLLQQPDLAWTLEQVAEHGSEAFYKGAVAKRMAAAMSRDGGLITADDLASYKPRWREPIVGRYHDHTIVTMPPPGGGLHVLQILNILEPFELAQYRHHSVEHVHLLAEAMKRAYADRAVHSGDPDFWQVPVDFITSKTYARRLARSIKLNRGTPSSEIAAAPAPKKESDQTTHISIVDRWGNAASSTQTVNTALGSKYVAAGTGVIMNNEMDDFAQRKGVANYFGGTALSGANLIKAGKRPLSSMSPSLVFDPLGRLRAVVGTPGGTKIMTSVLQVIVNTIDFQLPPKKAVFSTRVHHQWRYPEHLRFEPEGADAELIKALEAIGQGTDDKTAKKRGWRAHFCNVQAVFRDPNSGELTAVSDWRGTGRPKAR